MKFLKTYPWHLLSHFDIYIVKLWFYKEYPSVQHRPPQFNTSVPHKDHTFSAPKMPQFNTKNPSFPPPPSVPHQKPLSSDRLWEDLSLRFFRIITVHVYYKYCSRRYYSKINFLYSALLWVSRSIQQNRHNTRIKIRYNF